MLLKFTCVLGGCVASAVLLVRSLSEAASRVLGGCVASTVLLVRSLWRALAASVDSCTDEDRVSLEWRHQSRQSLEEGAGRRDWERGAEVFMSYHGPIYTDMDII